MIRDAISIFITIRNREKCFSQQADFANARLDIVYDILDELKILKK